MVDVERLLSDLGAASLVELRAGLEVLAGAVSSRRPVHEVQDGGLDLPGRRLPLRTYRPAAGPRPRLMWFHGGGFVSGSLDAIDATCRQLALRADVEVVSVGYRLAPEHRFPAGLDDCLAAAERLRPDAVGGDSAGGGLAAAVAQRHGGLRAHVLLCPWLDGTLGLPSVRAHSTADGLNESALSAFMQLYTDDPSDPGVSPLHATDHGNASPAVIVTAGLDPLRDDGERYADRLRDAGVTVALRRWEDEQHGFPGMTTVTPAAEESLQWVADRLRELL
ncbi:MAG: Alpha/beta hydrolase fold-3 domain protein [Frankiales bacterium]|nr:Alpha/beta hydrolase fold-3 domain protein [Frankiales bacterium]